MIFFLLRVTAQRKFTDSNTGDETERIISNTFIQWLSREGFSQENILEIDLAFDGTVLQQYTATSTTTTTTLYLLLQCTMKIMK